MRITYIAEGSKDLGMGHLIHQGAVMDKLKWRALESKRDVVIVDALEPESTQRLAIVISLVDDEAKLVLFNSLGDYPEADIIVTPDISPGFANTVGRKGQQVHFAGPRYWFLRNEFYTYKGMGWLDAPAWRPWNAQDWRPHEVGIMIGGTDALNLGHLVGASLQSEYAVTMLSGRDIAYQMALMDLMITGCGLGFWESLAVGTPVIPIAQNEAQAQQYGSVFKLGELDNLREMIEKREWVNPDPRFEIGQGTDEVIEEILR